MMLRRVFFMLAGLLVICSGLFSHAVLADDSQPGFLELKETTANRYSVLWRVPNRSGQALPLTLRLPESVHNLTEPVLRELPGSLVERRLIETGSDGLIGKRIGIDGLSKTNIDVLVRIEFANGATSTTLLKPAQPWLLVKGPRSAAQITWDYSVLGVEHILGGFDHLLFVLALSLIHI